MKKWGIILVTGFLQDYSKAAGLESQQRELQKRYHSRDDVEVYDHLLWRDDMKAMAAYLRREGVTHAVVAGYSYGGGYGAQRLSEQLIKQGITVEMQILCDPVHRSSILPKWRIFIPLTFRSITPWARVQVPSKVRAVVGLRQENNLPKAHPVRWLGHTWKLPLVDRPDVTHTNIDESPEWAGLLYSTIERVIGA